MRVSVNIIIFPTTSMAFRLGKYLRFYSLSKHYRIAHDQGWLVGAFFFFSLSSLRVRRVAISHLLRRFRCILNSDIKR